MVSVAVTFRSHQVVAGEGNFLQLFWLSALRILAILPVKVLAGLVGRLALVTFLFLPEAFEVDEVGHNLDLWKRLADQISSAAQLAKVVPGFGFAVAVVKSQ